MGVTVRGQHRDPCGDGNILHLDYQCKHSSFDIVHINSFLRCYHWGENWVKRIRNLCSYCF